MDRKLLDILACPICKGKLQYDKTKQQLICKFDKIAFPIEDGIPIMLEEKAKKIHHEDN